MRLAVSMGATGPARWSALAREAEAIGFDVLHLADHLVHDLPPPLTGLFAAAEATERIALGTLVLAVDFRHPAILAREVAMLAEHSGGRFELGIGAGHMEEEWDAVGIPFDRAGVRVDRLAEAAVVLRRLLAGEEVTFAGEHYRLDGHRCWPVPTSPVPILVGGNGDRVLRVAAEHADIVAFTGFTIGPDGRPTATNFTAAGLGARIDHVRRHAGDRWPLRTQVLVQRVALTADRRAAAGAIATELGAEVDDVLDSPFVLLGTADQVAEQLRERSERYGIETWTVFAEVAALDQPLDLLAPVIDRLRG